MTDWDRDSDTSFETDDFAVTHYRREGRKLVIVFISAGQLAPGQSVEEFRKSLQATGASVVFVRDKKVMWFNHHDFFSVMRRLEAIADSYDAVGTLGESMGGSGALLATRYVRGISRVLAFSPQFSISYPFIGFDLRYEAISRSIRYHHHTVFSARPEMEQVRILYGNSDWRDYLHACSFQSIGAPPTFVQDADHNVAAHLKGLKGNKLIRLVERFCNFELPFGPSALQDVFDADEVTDVPLRAGFTFEDDCRRSDALSTLVGGLLPPSGRPGSSEVSRGKRANQSSVSTWSRRPSADEDAQGAINGRITGNYSFHTDLEWSPWWSVDLGWTYAIEEVRIFNYLAQPEVAGRAAKFTIDLSIDGVDWDTVFERTDPTPFGGADTHPFTWRPSQNFAARHLRIRLSTYNWLHLDQVQVYGRPIAGDPPS